MSFTMDLVGFTLKLIFLSMSITYGVAIVTSIIHKRSISAGVNSIFGASTAAFITMQWLMPK